MDMKYELTDLKMTMADGTVVHRIRAVKDFTLADGTEVKTGDIGGWIENEDNLSHHGKAWVFDEAMVYGFALVSGDAMVYGHARIYDDAEVFGESAVYENAEVYEGAKVFGKSVISGNALIAGSSKVSSEQSY